MIRSFRDKATAAAFRGEQSRRIPATILNRVHMRLLRIHAAEELADLKVFRSDRLEKLKGDRRAQWSIRANNQWRICFRWEDGDAYDVEIVDYHK